MAGSAVSSLILFIAAMLVAAGVAGTLVTNVNEISTSIDDRSVDVRETIDTEISIISDPGSDAVYDDTAPTVTVLVKNTGETTLAADPGAHDVLVDGRYVGADALSISVVDGETWRSGSVARFEIDRSLDSGDHRAVVVANGDEEVFEFYVP